jgi:CrcB protein
MKLLMVFIGGGLGSALRWAIGLGVLALGSFSFPWATLISNVLSCGVMALALRFAEHPAFTNELRLLLFTGFCGGLSTFSTFSFESVEMLRSGNYGWAIGNTMLSVLLCFGILYWGLRR